MRAVDREKAVAQKQGQPAGGYWYLHHAVDDYSRLVYSGILNEEKKYTAAGFGKWGAQVFTSIGIVNEAVMTDNGACYRSGDFQQALGPKTKHRRIKPHRPQTNGKIEWFNRILINEWAYARACAHQSVHKDSYAAFVHDYNHHRAHTAIGGLSPADHVHNLPRKYN